MAASKLFLTAGNALEVIVTMFIWANSWLLTKTKSWMQKSTIPSNILKYRKRVLFYNRMSFIWALLRNTQKRTHMSPFLEGKSSTGRLGIDIHATAGKGDVGFCGNWTLEISVKQAVRVYAGMPIGQLIYFPVDGVIEVKYNQKKTAKYSGQHNKPVESMMWKKCFLADDQNR
jgi:hypothetical protein